MTDNASQPRIGWLLVLLALAASLFLVVASACGGDDDDDDGGDNASTATESTDGDGGDGDGEASPTEEGDDTGDDGSDAADELAALAGDYEQFDGYVKYQARDFSDDSFSSMALYQKGDKSRIDIESADGSFTIINTPDDSYVCTEGQCTKYPAGETGGLGDIFTSFIDPETIQSDFVELTGNVDYDVSEEEIAGIDATCFSASGDLDEETAGDESGQVCFAEGGLLLRITFGGSEGSGTLEAVEADTDVSDDVFDPPFEVIDLSDLGQ